MCFSSCMILESRNHQGNISRRESVEIPYFDNSREYNLAPDTPIATNMDTIVSDNANGFVLCY